jgi:hypothetical protein
MLNKLMVLIAAAFLLVVGGVAVEAWAAVGGGIGRVSGGGKILLTNRGGELQ